MAKVSIVVPVYYNQDNLVPLYEDIERKLLAVSEDEYEIVMVDDGSRDNSWPVMKQLAAAHPNVRVFHLARNFGSHAAMLCGLMHASGDCAVIKAADLQEPTEMILEMVQRWKQGSNVVLAVRAGREESRSQTAFANLYYWLVRKTALPQMPPTGFDIFLLDRQVIQVLARMDERNSAMTGQILWAGFKTDTVYYTRQARTIGKSRWTLRKKIRLVADTLYSFSTVPITVVTTVGVLAAFGSLAWALFVLVARLTGHIVVSGWTTMFIFNLFSFGVIMVTLGILGGYLWRTFDAARARPVFVEEYEARDRQPPAE